jgi:hypothetical protein
VFCEVETSSTAQQDMIFWIPWWSMNLLEFI